MENRSTGNNDLGTNEANNFTHITFSSNFLQIFRFIIHFLLVFIFYNY